MVIEHLAIAGYRSFRDVRLEVAPLTLVTGANGTGKSSLYRALRLIADIAQGRIVQSLAAEGGLQSTLWALAAQGATTITLDKRLGETLPVDADAPAWTWPTR